MELEEATNQLLVTIAMILSPSSLLLKVCEWELLFRINVVLSNPPLFDITPPKTTKPELFESIHHHEPQAGLLIGMLFMSKEEIPSSYSSSMTVISHGHVTNHWVVIHKRSIIQTSRVSLTMMASYTLFPGHIAF